MGKSIRMSLTSFWVELEVTCKNCESIRHRSFFSSVKDLGSSSQVNTRIHYDGLNSLAPELILLREISKKKEELTSK